MALIFIVFWMFEAPYLVTTILLRILYLPHEKEFNENSESKDGVIKIISYKGETALK